MNKILITILLIFSINCLAQQYRNPLDIPILLSANCGELRGNHFHSGIDIKTQGVTGKSVYSIEDGYVSRISVSPSGYGLAIYVDHPSTGHTSVYGHLQSYAPRIAEYVKRKQYEQENFRVDLKLDPSQFPLKKGDLIAYSGNTGSSGGPHVHFEIRETKSERVLDPLVYYKGMISDNKSPDVRGISAYPVPGRGVVNGSFLPLRQTITLLKNGEYSSPKESIEAWGLVGFGVKSYDRMDGTTNIYGVKIVRLFIDGKQIFQSNTESFSFGETRMINTFTDFADWKNNKSFYMQSFVEPGNTLSFYSADNRGYLNIDKEKTYDLRYELEDLYGNKTSYNFTIEGKKQNIPMPSGCSLVMAWDEDNRYISDLFSLIIKKGNLYNDLCFTLSKKPSTEYYSSVYRVNNNPVPLDKSGEVRIKMESDPLTNKKQYGIVQLNGNQQSWIGGTYNDGIITANIRELGISLAVGADTKAPIITPLLPKNWEQQGIVKIKLTDDLSGIATFRGTIDGKYALFEHDVKSNIYSYKIDPVMLKKGKTHSLVFTATDGCGNKSEYVGEFYF